MAIPLERLLLALILLGYLVIGGLFAALTPPWQAPDEPAHYNYIRQVAQTGTFPVIEMGDWQSAYQQQLVSAKFAPALLDRLTSIEYEDHQPPLYYLLAAPIYALTGGSLVALRLFSTLIGAGVVWCAYRLSKQMFPERLGVALAAAAFVAFLPQHVAMLAAVNNDGLSELWIGLTLIAVVAYLKAPASDEMRTKRWSALRLGILMALIFITKSTGYFLAALIPLALLLRWWTDRGYGKRKLSALIVPLFLFLLPALALGGAWWLRNIGVYGFPDFLGLGAHDRVVADQLRTADFIAQNGQQVYLERLISTTFNSFWGQFGWMALPLQDWMYRLFQALLLAAALGLLLERFAWSRRSPSVAASTGQRAAWVILLLTMILAVLAFVYYNTEFLQVQGRYLFPGLLPFALLMALGLDAWRRWLLPGLAQGQWLPLGVYTLLAPLDVYLIIWVIRPLLSP